MSSKIIFFQSSESGLSGNKVGLADLLITQLNSTAKERLFEAATIIVPERLMGIMLKDKITRSSGICANLDCVTLPGPVLEKIYLKNNPGQQLFDFSQAKFLIYQFLCQMNKNNTIDDAELSNYLVVAGEFDRTRAFTLATQLGEIFHEYLYLRSEELLGIDKMNLPQWQKQLWNNLQSAIAPQKTYLDIFSYFMTVDLGSENLDLPHELYIFALSSIYPSQLRILNRFSERINVYWYYLAVSHHYYGDLLSTSARAKLEKKYLRKPDLSLDDLYLVDGNPLVANLGQQSREFVELLQANEIEVYRFDDSSVANNASNTFLQLLQSDIRNLSFRIDEQFRCSDNTEYYANPVLLTTAKESEDIHDIGLASSIKINSCHNRMREIQVMFNELAELFRQVPDISASDILITAPDIDDYATYLQGVFENEKIVTTNHHERTLCYNLTGNRRNRSYKVLETIKFILNFPYHLPVNSLLELLMQAEIQKQLAISANDISVIEKWLNDNRVNFGYDAEDYQIYGYSNYSVHSFRQFLDNLLFGGFINQESLEQANQIPLLTLNGQNYLPYDNLDYADLALAHKLILLIDELQELRRQLYLDQHNWRELELAEVCQLLNRLQTQLFSDDDSLLTINRFIGQLQLQNSETLVNLAIINQLIDEFCQNSRTSLTLNGAITCASLRHIRNLPFKYVYILGLNFGEFPREYRPNRLSLLAYDWCIADRNYNLEDKQIFLDTVLAAKERLWLSYIGRRETDNSEIKPSAVLKLLITTLGQSCYDFQAATGEVLPRYNFRNVWQQHALHPFHNNRQKNFSLIWQKITAAASEVDHDLRWDFSRISPLKLADEQKQRFSNLTLNDLCRTFSYTNVNLLRTIGINSKDYAPELVDHESFDLKSRQLAIDFYAVCEKYAAVVAPEKLATYLITSGIFGYQQLGTTQFEHYYTLYQYYCRQRGQRQIAVSVKYSLTRKLAGNLTNIELSINDHWWVENEYVIVCDGFADIRRNQPAAKLDDVSYRLRIRGLICYLLLAHGVVVAGSDYPLAGVIIRQLTLTGETRDFKIQVDDPLLLLAKVISYYWRSLTNPLLIHKTAITEYAKARNERYKNGEFKYNALQLAQKAAAKYLADWQNYELDEIKNDPIFAAHAVDYFDFIQDVGGVNDILQIGSILAELRT